MTETIHKARRAVLLPLNELLRDHTNQYASYVLRGEHAADMNVETVDEARRILRDHGFHYEPVAALKRLEDGRVSDGSYVRRTSFTSMWQLHVHLFDRPGEDVVELHAHFERHWLRAPHRHYRGVGYDVERGVRLVEEIVDDRRVDYDV